MLLTWPSHAVIVRSESDVLQAVETIRSPFNLKTSTNDYGGRLLRGQVTVPRYGDREPGHVLAHAFNAFLKALASPGNWTEVPIGIPPIDSSVNTVLGSPVVVDGLLRGSVPSSLITDEMIVPGQLCRIGPRSYQVQAVSGSGVTLVPGVLPATGSPLVATTTVRARLTAGSRYTSPQDPTWMGPWVLSWDEWLENA